MGELTMLLRRELPARGWHGRSDEGADERYERLGNSMGLRAAAQAQVASDADLADAVREALEGAGWRRDGLRMVDPATGRTVTLTEAVSVQLQREQEG
jgi:hypothetical protein